MKGNIKVKKGAASFYIVAFSTLVLVVVATSFTLAILSNLTRTTNDDLAQSAYDSALAGIEDAKLAYYEYQKCLAGASNVSSGMSCSYVEDMIKKGEDCDMVARILGRTLSDGEVFISESTTTNDNNMDQAYTCVKINTSLNKYVGTLAGGQSKVITLPSDTEAKNVKSIIVGWKPLSDNFIHENKVVFPSFGEEIVPSMLAVGLVQTGRDFSLEQFEETTTDATNRGMVFLVPTSNAEVASDSDEDNYKGVYDVGRGTNIVNEGDIVKTNDHTVKNVPFVVYCNGDDEYECYVKLELPKPMSGDRNDNTFMLVLSLPYGVSGENDVNYGIWYCNDGVVAAECGSWTKGKWSTKSEETIGLTGQVEIDSTGRANNLYRRVKAVLEPSSSNSYSSYAFYALQLLGKDNDNLIKKPDAVTSEYNF